MSYYQNFKIVLESKPFKKYIRWAYKKGIDDLAKLNFRPDFEATDFACLLCGVGNENTADEFIKFVVKRNPKAKIWIIDLGAEQIAAVRKLIKNEYPKLNIVVRRINALELSTVIPKESLYWIETDGFIEYFDSPRLKKLFDTWNSLLKPTGFITTRDFCTGNGFSVLTDSFRIWLAKHWVEVSLYRHTHKEFTEIFNQLGLKPTLGWTPLPTYKRFSIIKIP